MSAVLRIALGALATVTAAGLALRATGAPPTEPRGNSLERQVAEQMAGMTLEDKIGQMFVLFAYGPGANVADQRNTDLYGVATPRRSASWPGIRTAIRNCCSAT
jgi:beta-N-acetylhexosaminidase